MTAPIAASTTRVARKPPRLVMLCATPRLRARVGRAGDVDADHRTRSGRGQHHDQQHQQPQRRRPGLGQHRGPDRDLGARSRRAPARTGAAGAGWSAGPGPGRSRSCRARTGVSSAPTAPGESCWAVSRYGTPHSSVNTIIENWVPMCPKKPSRVPGRRHTARSCRPISRADTDGAGDQCRRGVAHHGQRQPRAHARWPRRPPRTPSPSRPRAAGPRTAPRTAPARTGRACRSAARTTGTRRAGNQRGTRLNTALNTIASPAPTSTRASTASGSSVVTASSS